LEKDWKPLFQRLATRLNAKGGCEALLPLADKINAFSSERLLDQRPTCLEPSSSEFLGQASRKDPSPFLRETLPFSLEVFDEQSPEDLLALLTETLSFCLSQKCSVKEREKKLLSIAKSAIEHNYTELLKRVLRSCNQISSEESFEYLLARIVNNRNTDALACLLQCQQHRFDRVLNILEKVVFVRDDRMLKMVLQIIFGHVDFNSTVYSKKLYEIMQTLLHSTNSKGRGECFTILLDHGKGRGYFSKKNGEGYLALRDSVAQNKPTQLAQFDAIWERVAGKHEEEAVNLNAINLLIKEGNLSFSELFDAATHAVLCGRVEIFKKLLVTAQVHPEFEEGLYSTKLLETALNLFAHSEVGFVQEDLLRALLYEGKGFHYFSLQAKQHYRQLFDFVANRKRESLPLFTAAWKEASERFRMNYSLKK